jgi:serine/threonine-protein kinase
MWRKHGKPFIVMGLSTNTLRDALQEGPFSIDRFVSVALQICPGWMPSMGKSSPTSSRGILLTSKEVKIADCGLAARFVHTEGLAEKCGIAGTPAYMSPEQARGEPLDQRSDLFSLGVVFYEMLTGHLPFEADHPTALLYLIMNADPPPLEPERPDLPAELIALVRRLLHKNPDRRYQTVGDLAGDLLRLNARGSGR